MTTTVSAPTVATFSVRAQEVTEALSRAEAAFDDAKRSRATLMAEMRRAGHTWSEIGSVLGVSQQRANKLGQAYGIH